MGGPLRAQQQSSVAVCFWVHDRGTTFRFCIRKLSKQRKPIRPSRSGFFLRGRSQRMRRKISAALTSLTLIFLVALGLRLAYGWYQQRDIPRPTLQRVPFLYEPGNIAYSLAIGHGFGSPFRVDTGPTAWTTPIYPLIVASIFRVFGTLTFNAYVAAILLNILLSALTCVPVYFAGKHIGGAYVAAGAAWLWGLFPNAVIIPSQWIWDTSLSGLLVATILWATLAWADSRRVRDWCAYGVLWGVALMTNATLLAGLPFLLGWMAYRARQTGPGWVRRPILAVVLIVLCCAPWTIRNYYVLHRFIPLRSALGLQLWLGNNDAYQDRFPAWLHPVDNATERARYIAMGEGAYMAEKQREAIAWIWSHPRREAQLFKDRFVATWIGTPHPARDFRESGSLLVRAVLFTNFLVAIGALIGIAIVYIRREWREFAIPLTALPILFPFAFYLSQALFRYRYPIDPIVCLLVAIAVANLVQSILRSRGPSVA